MGIKERKVREKEARREEIIKAAEKIFFEKGLGQATMDEIAEAAELSKGTLYLYHKSKEDLYLALAQRGMEILLGMFQQAVATGEPVIKLIQNLLEAYYQYFKQHRSYFQTAYFFETPQFHSMVTEEMMKSVGDADERLWKLVVDLLRRAIDEGMLHKQLDPVEAAVMLWSNAQGILRLMDRAHKEWTDRMGIDLEQMLRTSNMMLLEAMMTRKATKLYPSLLLHHDAEKTDSSAAGAQ